MNENQNAVVQYHAAISKKMSTAGMNPQDVARELSFAAQIWNRDPQLQKCSPESIAAAVVNIANIGLTLNPAAKEAVLIARWNTRRNISEAVLEPMYPGLVKLATKAGRVRSVVSNIVYEGDNFSIDLANNSNPVKHHPQLVRANRGQIIGAYSIATLSDGLRQVEWMERQDILNIRERSEGWKAFQAGKMKSTPWLSDEGEMMRKTVLKRLLKYLPRMEDDSNYIQRQFDEAVELSNQDYPASLNQATAIETLLPTANIRQEEKDSIYDMLSHGDMSSSEATKIIKNLEENQLDDIRYNGGSGRKMKAIADDVKNAATDEKR